MLRQGLILAFLVTILGCEGGQQSVQPRFATTKVGSGPADANGLEKTDGTPSGENSFFRGFLGPELSDLSLVIVRMAPDEGEMEAPPPGDGIDLPGETSPESPPETSPETPSENAQSPAPPKNRPEERQEERQDERLEDFYSPGYKLENPIEADQWADMTDSERVRALMDGARLSCEPGAIEHCDSNLALVLQIRESESEGVIPSQCTGTLLSSGLIVTAAHCLSQELLRDPLQCSSSLVVGLYQGDDKPLQQATCRNIVEVHQTLKQVTRENGQSLSEPDLKKTDLVFIEVEALPGEQLPQGRRDLSRAGFVSEETVQFLGITPFGGSRLGGRVQLRDCEPKTHSYILPEHVDHRSPVVNIMGENCEAPKGNSGSVVFSKNSGEILGVVQAYLYDAKTAYEEAGFTVAERVFNPVVVTNFACLESEVLSQMAGASGSSCGSSVQSSQRSLMEAERERVERAFSVTQENLRENARTSFLSSSIEWIQLKLENKTVQDVQVPLRLMGERVAPVFKCHRILDSRVALQEQFRLPTLEYVVYEYLDSTLRTQVNASPVENSAVSYQIQKRENAAFVNLREQTSSGSGINQDLVACEASSVDQFIVEI